MSYWICKILHGVNEDALCYELDLMGIAYLARTSQSQTRYIAEKKIKK